MLPLMLPLMAEFAFRWVRVFFLNFCFTVGYCGFTEMCLRRVAARAVWNESVNGTCGSVGSAGQEGGPGCGVTANRL
jgi:hypothetical protein